MPNNKKAIEACDLPVPLPNGAAVEKNGKYLRVKNAHGHPIAGLLGRIPYHRLVLYETLGRPTATRCHWCGYVLPWTSTIANAVCHIVVADHLDGDTTNNKPVNLVPSCNWCNMNRSWAESHVEFWAQWRRWMRDVPPDVRPNLPQIGKEFGISAEGYWSASRAE